MLSKKEIKTLICDKMWTFEALTDKNEAVWLYLGKSEGHGFLTIKFKEDGEIDFPTKVGFFPPEFRRWDFDEEKQEIIFFNNEGNISKRVRTPQQDIYGTMTLNLIGENARFINDHRNDVRIVEPQVLGGNCMLFIPAQHFSMDLFKVMAQRGYNVHVVDSEAEADFYRDVYEYVIRHPKLENIIISRNGYAELKEPKEEGNILFGRQEEHLSLDYCVGKRPMIVELLVLIVTKSGESQLASSELAVDFSQIENTVFDHFAERDEFVTIS